MLGPIPPIIGGMTCLGLSGWVCHDKCTTMFGYTLDWIYGESWCKTINCYDSPNYFTTWILNLKRTLNLYQNQ